MKNLDSKDERLPASLAVLTWKAPATLENTLSRLERISHLFRESLVVCQASDPDEIKIVKKYGFKPILIKENLGIQNGLKKAVASCQFDHVLLLENDCYLAENKKNAEISLRALFHLLVNEAIDYGTLQQLSNVPSKTFTKYWDVSRGQLRRKLLGYCRWKVANSVASEAINYIEDPMVLPMFEGREGPIYTTRSRYRRWSNRAVFVSKKFFLNKLIPFAEANPTSRHCNGLPELEHRINSRRNRGWWLSQRFRVGVAKPGLFSHCRKDRSENDDKWKNGGAVNPSD